MTEELCHHPDLLRRFVPTPFVFIKRCGLHDICVESNDLEIALGIRQSDLVVGRGNHTGRLFCKVIRDLNAPVDGRAVSIIADGVVRVLQNGDGGQFSFTTVSEWSSWDSSPAA